MTDYNEGKKKKIESIKRWKKLTWTFLALVVISLIPLTIDANVITTVLVLILVVGFVICWLIWVLKRGLSGNIWTDKDWEKEV